MSSVATRPLCTVRPHLLCSALSNHVLTRRAHVDPNASAEAKQHAREVLQSEGLVSGGNDGEDHQTCVIAGYKAALHSTYLCSPIPESLDMILIACPCIQQTRACLMKPRSTLAHTSRSTASPRKL